METSQPVQVPPHQRFVVNAENAERQWRQLADRERKLFLEGGERGERRKAMETDQPHLKPDPASLSGERGERRKAMETGWPRPELFDCVCEW